MAAQDLISGVAQGIAHAFNKGYTNEQLNIKEKLKQIRKQNKANVDAAERQVKEKESALRLAKQSVPPIDQTTKDRLNQEVDQAKSNLEQVKAAAKQSEQDLISEGKKVGFSDPKQSFKDIGNDLLQGKVPSSNVDTDGFRLSDTFYRDYTAGMLGRSQGNRLDVQAASHKELAQNLRQDAAQRQQEAQRAQQIANRNEYAESGKIASMQNDAQNRQNIANKQGLSGSAAALMRTTNTPDVQAQQHRQDIQRTTANELRQAAGTRQRAAIEDMSIAGQRSIDSRDFNRDTDEAVNYARGLSSGNTDTNTGNTNTNTNNTNPTSNETGNTNNTNTGNTNTNTNNPTPNESDNTSNTNIVLSENPNHNPGTGNTWGPGVPETAQTPQQSQQSAGSDSTGSDSTGSDNTGSDNTKNRLVQLMKEYMTQAKTGGNPDNDPEYLQNHWKEIAELEQQYKKDHPEYNIQTGAGQDFNKVFDTNLPSDRRLKDIETELSDLRMKYIKEDYDTFGRPSDDDLAWLVERAGLLDNDTDDDFDDSSIAQGYAEHIKNYVYNYKPEAQDIDPSIDPNEEHIGPMAQDIEKVNPACIKETADGVKTVDTGRLALMNAGAIGDVARKLEEVLARLDKLGV